MANYFSNALQGFGQQSVGLYDQLLGSQQQFGGDLYSQMYGPQGTYNGLLAGLGYGQGGVQLSPDQQAAIMGSNGQGGLSGVDSYGQPISSQQLQALGLSQAQIAQIQGNPGQVLANTEANVNTLGQNITQGNQNVTGAAGQGMGMITGSVDPRALGLDPTYTSGIAGALGTEGQQLGAATGNRNLNLSDQFNQQYNFSDADKQAMISAAGTQVGNQFQTGMDTMARNAAASGEASPLALAAANTRSNVNSAAQAGDAMTQARIQATQTQLGVEQAKEQMRLGSAQDISSRQMQAAEALGNSTVGALGQEQGYRLQGGIAGQGLNLQAAEQAAGLGYGAAQFGAGQLNQGTEFATNANMGAGEYANTNAQQAGQWLGNNQQQFGLQGQAQQFGQQSGLYNQQFNTNQALAGRAAGLGQSYLNQRNLYSNQLQNLYGSQAGQYQAGLGQQNSALAGRTGAGMGGYTAGYQTQSTPLWQQILGGISGAAGAFGNVGKGMAGAGFGAP
jgi:hypothetical protein